VVACHASHLTLWWEPGTLGPSQDGETVSGLAGFALRLGSVSRYRSGFTRTPKGLDLLQRNRFGQRPGPGRAKRSPAGLRRRRGVGAGSTKLARSHVVSRRRRVAAVDARSQLAR